MHISLQPKQTQLYRLLAATGPTVATIIGGGGAKGGGKSDGARGCALLLAVEFGKLYPGITITIVRRTYGDLKKNHIDPFIRKYPELVKYYTEANGLDLGNSKIAFMYAENAIDVKRKFLGGYESAIIIIDEAQQFSEEELQWITTAARWTDATGEGIPKGLCKTLMLFNPGGPGSTYIRRVFWLKQYVGEEKPHKYAFIHIFGFDNYEWFRGQVDGLSEEQFYAIRGKCSEYGEECRERSSCCRFQMFIHQTEEGQKYNAYPESMRAGYLLGSFDSFAGQYFAGVWYEKKHVLSSQSVDDLVQYWWNAWCSTDWGYGEKHWCFTYWAVTGKISPTVARTQLQVIVQKPVDIVIIYRELMVHRVEEADFAHRVVEVTPEPERKCLNRWVAGSDTKQMMRHMRHSPREIIDGICGQYGFPKIQSAHDEPGSRSVNAGLMRGMLHRTARMRFAPEALPVDEQEERLPLVFVSAECPLLISSIPVLLDDGENGKPEDVQKMEQMADDAFDACFVAGTLVRAESGEIPIERIKAGDRVWTRQGLSVVRRAWISRKDTSTVIATFSDGTTVTCTPDHRFWANNRWSAIDACKYGDKIVTWKNIQQSSFSEASSIPRCELGTIALLIGFCTAISGLLRTAKSQLSMRFTIGTETTATTNCLTWNAYPSPTIESCTRPGSYRPKNGSAFKMPQGNGMDLQKASNGTKNTLRRWALAMRNSISNALNVALSIVAGWGPASADSEHSARLRVAQCGGDTIRSITSKSRAPFAERCLAPVSITIPSAVLESVPSESVSLIGLAQGPRSDVYDIEVEDGEFFANGILVHNCKYLLAEYASVKDQAPREVRLYDTMMNAKEQTHKVSAEGHDAAANHNAYMAFLKFEQQEGSRQRRGKRA